MKDKDAQTTPGMSSAQPSRVSDEGRGAPFEVTLSVPQTLVGLLARMRLWTTSLWLLHIRSSGVPGTKLYVGWSPPKCLKSPSESKMTTGLYRHKEWENFTAPSRAPGASSYHGGITSASSLTQPRGLKMTELYKLEFDFFLLLLCFKWMWKYATHCTNGAKLIKTHLWITFALLERGQAVQMPKQAWGHHGFKTPAPTTHREEKVMCQV